MSIGWREETEEGEARPAVGADTGVGVGKGERRSRRGGESRGEEGEATTKRPS